MNSKALRTRRPCAAPQRAPAFVSAQAARDIAHQPDHQAAILLDQPVPPAANMGSTSALEPCEPLHSLVESDPITAVFPHL
jgi:hypothetical protein